MSRAVWRLTDSRSDRVPGEVWSRVHNIVLEVVIKTISKKKSKKAKWSSEEALQIAEERREVKGKREKENSEYRVLKNNKER